MTEGYLSVSENFPKGSTQPPEEARELVNTGRRGHIDATYDLYKLRQPGRRADRKTFVTDTGQRAA